MVSKSLKLQDEQLQKVRDGIEKARAVRLQQLPHFGEFAVIGKLQKSSIYIEQTNQKYYTIIDNSGKIVCYTRPGNTAFNTNLDKLVGHKVGLVGEIKTHPQTSGALVEFQKAIVLK
ncbi:MAG: hypothetical protein ACYSSI_06245 [Planctomycetota bacterium]|jgi:hypothetical protein